MPSLSTTSLKSPPTNAFGLVQFLQQRLPGYDESEYLREINAAAIHVWEEISKLRNNYFTNVQTVSVVKAQAAFDLMFNADGALSAVVSPRIYQVIRVRVQPPSSGVLQSTTSLHPNDPDFLSIASNVSPNPANSGPYYWYLFGRNNIQWGLPLAIGTQIEVTYTFWPLALTYLSAGTITSSGKTVTGNGTNFTQLLQPDFQNSLPASKGQEEILVELICNNSQVYSVATITSDTQLTTANTIAPVIGSAGLFVLSAMPEVPREHIRVIGSIAMGAMYSVAGDDARVAEWTAKSEKNMQMMKDSLMERQAQNPPRKGRFPFGISRRNRVFNR